MKKGRQLAKVTKEGTKTLLEKESGRPLF